jgi:DNA-binding response OmpR family regulator
LKIIVVARQTEEIANLCSDLNRHGFECIPSDCDNALEKVRNKTTELLLVEFNDVPEIESLYRSLRQKSGLPLIALIPQEKLDNLNGYADDFIVTPCNIIELQARIKRLISKKTESVRKQITINGLTIDLDKYEIFVDGRLIPLTFKEYELLTFFAEHPGKVYTRDTLLNQIWGEDYFGGDRTVDVHIRRLRSKIEDSSHIYIETVRNIGYRFINP